MLNIYKNVLKYYLTYLCKKFIIDRIVLFFTKKIIFLMDKYPLFFTIVNYFFTFLNTFGTGMYNIIFEIYCTLKIKYPLLYSIVVYLYSEYLSIIKGDISRNVLFCISLYILYDLNQNNLLLFILLLLNSLVKEYLSNNT